MDDPRHFNAHPLDPAGNFLNGFTPLHPYPPPGYHYPPNIYHEESSFSPDYHQSIPVPQPNYRGHFHAPKDPFHDGGYPHYPGHGWYFNQGPPNPRYQPHYGPYYDADPHHSRREYYDESSSGRRPGKRGSNSQVRLAYVPRQSEDHDNGYQNRHPPDLGQQSGRQFQSHDHSRQPLHKEEADHLSQNFPSLRSPVISTALEEPPPLHTHQVQQPPQLAPTQQQPSQVAQQTQASQQPLHLQPKPPPSQQSANNSKNNYTVLTPSPTPGAPPVAQVPTNTPPSQLRILKPEPNNNNTPTYQYQEANYNGSQNNQRGRPQTPTNQKSKSGKQNSKSQPRSNWVVLSSPSSSRHHANNTQSSKCSTPKPINLPRADSEPEKPARAWEIKKDSAQVSAWEIKRDPQDGTKKDNPGEPSTKTNLVKEQTDVPQHQTNHQNHPSQHHTNHLQHTNHQNQTNHQQHPNPPISSHFFRRGRDDYLSSHSSSPSPSPSPSSSGGMSGSTYSASASPSPSSSGGMSASAYSSSSRSISPSPPPSPVPKKPKAWEIRQPEPVLDFDLIFNENITNKKTGRPQQEIIEHLHISVGLTGKSFVARITGYDQYGMLVDIIIDTEYHKYELHQRILWTEFPTEIQNWTLQQKLQLSRERMPIRSEFKVHVSDIHAMKVLRLQPSKYPYPILRSLSVPLAPARCPFRYLVVIDFEATCDYAPNPLVNTRTAEIIEFPWVVIDTTTFKIIDKHQIYVKPDFIEGVTPYATKLTGITQHMLVNQATLATVIKKFDDYVSKHFGEKRNFSLLTDGIWDLQVQLRTEAKRKQVDLKWYYHQYIDIKEEFRKFWPWFPTTFQPGLNIMLNAIGMEFEGKPHCGIEDAQNIARVVLQLLTLGHSFSTQKSIPAAYDPFQDQQFVDFGSVADANAWQCPNTTCGLWNRPWKKECKFCFRSKNR